MPERERWDDLVAACAAHLDGLRSPPETHARLGRKMFKKTQEVQAQAVARNDLELLRSLAYLAAYCRIAARDLGLIDTEAANGSG